MKKIVFIVLSVLIFSLDINAQLWKQTENLRYNAYYYSSGMWNNVGVINFSLKPSDYQGHNIQKIMFVARTNAEWDNYFKVRDIYQSFISPKTGKPYIFIRNVNEGNFSLYIKYLFSRKKGIAKMTKKFKGREYKKNIPITSNTYDMLSSLYYIRSLDFANMAKGKATYMNILADGKITKVKIIYLGTETITHKGKKIRTYKITGKVIGNEKLSNIPNYIWLSADAKKIPILITATLPVGKIKIKLLNNL